MKSICTAAALALATFLPAQGGSESVEIAFDVDGKRVVVKVDGNDVDVSIDGKAAAADRVQRHGTNTVIKDESGKACAHVSKLGNGLTFMRTPTFYGNLLQHATIGIEPGPLSKALAEHLELNPEEVIFVARVFSGRAAAKAGMQDNDVIMEIDGTAPVSEATLREALKGKRAGDEIKLKVLRRGKEVDVTVKCEVGHGLSYTDVSYPQGLFGNRGANYTAAIKALIDAKVRGQVNDTVRAQYEEAIKALRSAQGNQLLQRFGQPTRGFESFNFVRDLANQNRMLELERDHEQVPVSRFEFERAWRAGKGPVPDAVEKKFDDLEKRFDRLEKAIEKLGRESRIR